MMKNSATIQRHHQQTPLASCEARARLALERGHLSQAAYQTLMGITAEVLLTQQTEVGCAYSADVNKSPEKAAMRKQITPCDTPPICRREEEEEEPPSSSSSLSQAYDDKMLSSKLLQLPAEDYATMNDPRSLHEEYASVLESLPPRLPSPCALDDSPDDGANSDRSLLEKMQEQGFDLSSRAVQFWTHDDKKNAGNNDGTSLSSAAGSAIKEEHDRRLLQFVDICLKTYPPPPTTTTSTSCPPTATDDKPDSTISEYSRDIIWQNRLGLIVPKPTVKDGTRIESENARWEVKFEDLLHFKAIHGHCNVPFRYDVNKSLGGWVQKQRDLNKKGKLPEGRYERLDKVEFSWVLSNKKIPKINDNSIHSYEDLWEFRYKGLVDFKGEHGHCNIPYRYSKDVQLGRWVQNQREFYKRRTLSGERYQRLVDIGFSWSLRKGGKWGTAKRKPSDDAGQNIESI